MKKFFIKNQKGYAILFTIVIVSAVSVITAGLTNTVYKQMILSSLAKDSQTAFYQSDTATDCALFADRVLGLTLPNITTTGGIWSCGGVNNLLVTLKSDGSGGYNIDPAPQTLLKKTDPCFSIDVTKDNITNPVVIETLIKARGYNFCDKTNPRTVEREIDIEYQLEK